MTSWPIVRGEGRLKELLGNQKETKFWTTIFNKVYAGKIDTWDYQWVFANWVNGRLSVVPAVNLISNIGFGVNATHTTGVSELENLPITPIKFPLSHPIGVFKSLRADRFSEKKCFKASLWRRICNKVAGWIR